VDKSFVRNLQILFFEFTGLLLIQIKSLLSEISAGRYSFVLNLMHTVAHQPAILIRLVQDGNQPK